MREAHLLGVTHLFSCGDKAVGYAFG